MYSGKSTMIIIETESSKQDSDLHMSVLKDLQTLS